MSPELLNTRLSRRRLLQKAALAGSALVISSTIGCGEEDRIVFNGQKETASPAPEIVEGLDFEFSIQLTELINQFRAQNGLNFLKVHAALALAAKNYSEILAQNDWFSHDSPNGSSPWDRMTQAGFPYNTFKGENLVKGDIQGDPQVFFDSLVESEGHKANMLNPNYKFIGVVCYIRNFTYPTRWCVQEFGGEYVE